MAEAGWELDTSGCPGVLNTQAINSLANFTVKTDVFGNSRMVEGKWEYHKGKCVNPECKHKGEELEVGPCSICKDCEKIL